MNKIIHKIYYIQWFNLFKQSSHANKSIVLNVNFGKFSILYVSKYSWNETNFEDKMKWVKFEMVDTVVMFFGEHNRSLTTLTSCGKVCSSDFLVKNCKFFHFFMYFVNYFHFKLFSNDSMTFNVKKIQKYDLNLRFEISMTHIY